MGNYKDFGGGWLLLNALEALNKVKRQVLVTIYKLEAGCGSKGVPMPVFKETPS